MRTRTSIWIVVADSRSAQTYRLVHASRVMLFSRDKTSPSRLLLEKVTGTKWNAASAYTHAMAGSTSSQEAGQEHMKRFFMKDIALKLKMAFSRKACEQLVLVMPPRLLGILREELNGEASGKILAVIPKDLRKCRPADLLKHLDDILPVMA